MVSEKIIGGAISFLSFTGGVLSIPYLQKYLQPLTPYFQNQWIFLPVVYLLAFALTIYILPKVLTQIYISMVTR